jgi:hypothetical protein
LCGEEWSGSATMRRAMPVEGRNSISKGQGECVVLHSRQNTEIPMPEFS